MPSYLPTATATAICSLIIALSFFACEKSTDWPLESDGTARLVVEAILTNENKTQEVRLSLTYPDLNGAAPAVDGAEVYVEVEQVIYSFLPDPEQPGRYLSENPFAVVGGHDYTLHINWEGTEYTAVSRLSEVFPIPQPTFVAVGNTGRLRLGEFIPAFSPFEQAMYRIDIDWSQLDTAELTRARIYQYTFSSIDMSQLVLPPRELVEFPKGSTVVIRKFGLNDDFAEYLRAKAIETDWSGAFFYSVSDNLPTNIPHDGLGFFSTCAVLTDSLIAQ